MHFDAEPYGSAMGEFRSIDDGYGWQAAREVIGLFLVHARTWRGADADAARIKSE